MPPLLDAITILFGLAIVVSLLCLRLGIPGVVGFLLTGVLAGPHGLGLVSATAQVESLAEIGVILLLFTIGLECSLPHLLSLKTSALAGGTLQMLLTTLAIGGFALILGLGHRPAIFLGLLLSLSSTAIVLKLLAERMETDSPHGRLSLGILVFQDLSVIPIMLLIPFLARDPGAMTSLSLWSHLPGVGLVLAVLLAARWFVPRLLHLMTTLRLPELFLLSVVFVVFAIAWATARVGLSLALGAFLAGLLISRSEYSHHALGNMLPFRDVFLSFFFISVGMLLDFHSLSGSDWVWVAASTTGLLLLKTVLAGVPALVLGYPLRSAILLGLGLSQVGEFAFILARAGIDAHLLSAHAYQLFLAVSVLSMMISPFLIATGPRLATRLLTWPWPAFLKNGWAGAAEPAREPLRDHLVIVGYGPTGRHVARSAAGAGISHLVIEINPETVREARRRGDPLIFGDATQPAVLRHAGVDRARVLLIVIPDPIAARRLTALARHLNPHLHIIVRMRFIKEIEPLYRLGANEVIPEELESAVEILVRVLKSYLVPQDRIAGYVDGIRADGYQMLRNPAPVPTTWTALGKHLSRLEIQSLSVAPASPLAGKTLAETALRQEWGLTVLAMQRGEEVTENPGASTRLAAGDAVIVMGTAERLAAASPLFGPSTY